MGDQMLRAHERQLRKEIETLSLYRAIVDNGPDLFSVHTEVVDAPFRFASEDFHRRLHIPPAALIGQPLASIVDSRDRDSLKAGLLQVLDDNKENAGRVAGGGKLLELRVSIGGLSYRATMSMSIGSSGIIVVTRLYE